MNEVTRNEEVCALKEVKKHVLLFKSTLDLTDDLSLSIKMDHETGKVRIHLSEMDRILQFQKRIEAFLHSEGAANIRTEILDLLVSRFEMYQQAFYSSIAKLKRFSKELDQSFKTPESWRNWILEMCLSDDREGASEWFYDELFQELNKEKTIPSRYLDVISNFKLDNFWNISYHEFCGYDFEYVSEHAYGFFAPQTLCEKEDGSVTWEDVSEETCRHEPDSRKWENLQKWMTSVMLEVPNVAEKFDQHLDDASLQSIYRKALVEKMYLSLDSVEQLESHLSNRSIYEQGLYDRWLYLYHVSC